MTSRVFLTLFLVWRRWIATMKLVQWNKFQKNLLGEFHKIAILKYSFYSTEHVYSKTPFSIKLQASSSLVSATEFQVKNFLRKSCNCVLVWLVSGKLGDASFVLKITWRYLCKSKDVIVRNCKLLLATYVVIAENGQFDAFTFLHVLCSLYGEKMRKNNRETKRH